MNYIVRLVIGDICYNSQVRIDLKKELDKRKVKYKNLNFIDETIKSVQQLVSQLEKSDIVVSPRFHNIILSLILNKPVIAISYQEKFQALMQKFGLARYNVGIDNMDSNILIEKLLEAERNSEKLRLHIGQKVYEQAARAGFDAAGFIARRHEQRGARVD